ncbi:MAG: phosphodiester glycosidase family protein [Candidatus Moraniibacteriota bacterium]
MNDASRKMYYSQKQPKSELPQEEKESGSAWRKRLQSALLVLLSLLIALVLFIKLDTSGAAWLTDNVLRPVVGDGNIIRLEKIFFNTSDLVERVTKNENSVEAPRFEGEGSGDNLSGGKLDVTPLQVTNGFSPIEGEGVWHNRALRSFPDKEVMAYTFVRPDPARPYAVTTIVQMDMSVMHMGSVAGTKQPGGPVGKPGPGIVPKDIVASGNLIAAFDGGFQYKDGEFGMIVGDTTYLPLKNDLATLVGYTDGSLKIIDYTGQPLGDGVEFVRQNCPILIQDGQMSVTDPRNKKLWGRLAAGTVDIYTWRSGVGLTKDGNLLFAVGNNLTPTTLAEALKEAGAVNAIQLDINPIWVRFNIFEPADNGRYDSSTLTKDLQDGSKEYLNGYAKDFFYLYKK